MHLSTEPTEQPIKNVTDLSRICTPLVHSMAHPHPPTLWRIRLADTRGLSPPRVPAVQIPRWMDVMESAVLTMAAQSDWLRQPLLAEVCHDGLGQSSMRWDASLLVAKLKKYTHTSSHPPLPAWPHTHT